MKRYNNITEVKPNEYGKYRLEIFKGKYKGCYIYDTVREEREFLIKISVDIELDTMIFFSERVHTDTYGKAWYDNISMVNVKAVFE